MKTELHQSPRRLQHRTSSLLWSLIQSIAILALLLWLTACASTTLYRDGQKIASFQGDMVGLDYRDGDTRLRVDAVDHSSATKAYGESSVGRIQAAGAAVAGATLLAQ